MTATTSHALPAREEQVATPLPWRRMAWVTWRQHRLALAGVAALFIVITVWLTVTGIQLHHAYAAAIRCHSASSFVCGRMVNAFNGKDNFMENGLLLQAVPALIGAFVGAPVLAREFESGTFRFAWTQGFGRWRWTLSKLVLLAVVLSVAAGILSALFTWYYQPYFATRNDALGLSEVSPLTAGLFDLRGVTFAAWTLAGVAIGGLAGMLIRRVVAAIVATLATCAALLVVAGEFLRQHYLTPIVTTRLNVSNSAWIISQHWTTRGGRPVSQSVLARVLQAGPAPLAGKGGVPKSMGTWQYLVRHGYTLWTSYEPASRFWSLQGIEGGWLLVLSVLVVAVTIWLVRRRAI